MKKLQYILPIILLFSSCVSQKDWVYFQGEPNSKEKVTPLELRYQANDLLSINVSARDLDAARPFNLFVSSPNSSRELTISGQQQLQTYLVDEMGQINFPVLGKLSLGGLSRNEAIALLENKLKDYIKDPIVTLRLTNFKISVLGEVNKPGTYTIENEQISLPQAIALAGDLSIKGKRTNLLLLREEGGVLTKNFIDLRGDTFFNSPYYFLRPNDVLYVEPNASKVRSSTDVLQYTSISLSIIIILTNLANILLQ